MKTTMLNPSQSIRVLLVEDEEWVRESLRFILSCEGSGVTIAASTRTGAEALSYVDRGAPIDVALIDLGLPDIRGADLIRQIRRKRPGLATVVFTVFADAPHVFEAIRAGAQGYLLKSSPSQQLISGLQAAAAGGAPMTPTIARLILDVARDAQLEQQPSDALYHELTDRERDVLSLLAKGLSYGDVAKALDIGLGTVQGHVKRIYAKLEVSSKAEAATVAQRMGLV